MLIKNNSKDINEPCFSARFKISGNSSLLSTEQISTLSRMTESLGKKNDIVELNIGSEIMDWVEVNSQNRLKKCLSGYKMDLKTSIVEVSDRDLSVADIQQRFWHNYDKFSPFEVMKNWIISVKNKVDYNQEKININPSLYNFSNPNWVRWASFQTPDLPPQKPKVDLEKCQYILDIKLYGDVLYKNILTNAANDSSVEILADDLVENLPLEDEVLKGKLKKKIAYANRHNDAVRKNHTQTKEIYSDKNGVYTAERLTIHKNILEEIFKNSNQAKPEEGNSPTLIMIGGRGGSGKSRFGKKGNTQVYDTENYIVLNSDEIKKKLPEYRGYNSLQLHEESWDILNNAIQLSIKKHLNVVLDGTLSDITSNENLLKQFVNAGYNIEMYFMYLSRKKSAERALLRFNYNNRYVPLDVLLKMKDNEKNFDELKKYASKWAFYCNDVDYKDDPILIDFSVPNLLEWLLKNCSIDK